MNTRTQIAIAFAATVFSAASAFARDQGIINQAGVYERSMAVYLHPAGYFFEPQAVSTPVIRNMDHPAVAARRAPLASDTQAWSHPALRNGVSRGVLAAGSH